MGGLAHHDRTWGQESVRLAGQGADRPTFQRLSKNSSLLAFKASTMLASVKDVRYFFTNYPS